MRGLVMDFPADQRRADVDDEYLFGPAFLVAPVTEFKARSREVYLPAGATGTTSTPGAAPSGRSDDHGRRAV